MRRDDDRWEWEDHKSSHHAVWPKHGKKQYKQINASVSLKPYLRVLKIKRAASSPHKAIAGEGAALQLIFFLERAMNLWPLELFLLWRRAPQLFVFPERKQSSLADGGECLCTWPINLFLILSPRGPVIYGSQPCNPGRDILLWHVHAWWIDGGWIMNCTFTGWNKDANYRFCIVHTT